MSFERSGQAYAQVPGVQEVRPHDPTAPRATLVEGSGTSQVPVVCADVPLP